MPPIKAWKKSSWSLAPRAMLQNVSLPTAHNPKENRIRNLPAALTSPIWLPLLFVIGLVGFIFLFVACILIFVFGVLAVTFVGVGLWLMFVYPPTGLVMVGAGLICAALIILCIMMFVGVGSAVKLIKNTIHSRRQQI